jgi:uncharacterized protein (TIGR03437 family)
VNAQLPSDLAEGSASFQLKFADGSLSPPVTADVKALAPAIFTYTPSGNACTGTSVICPTLQPQAAAFHANSAIPVDSAHPAAAGEAIEIYGTGLGTTNPPVPAGQPAPGSPPAQTVTTPQVMIGNLQARVTFSGLTPGLAGVYQVNVVVPGGLRSGAQNVQWNLGGAASMDYAPIWVQ